jgi:alcohol dehydrogenase
MDTVQAKRIDAAKLITHRFKLVDIVAAYEAFAKAAETQALKVIIEA